MKKVVVRLLALTMAISMLVLATGCGNKKPANQMDLLSQIKEKGKIVVGTSADYPPYEFHKEIGGKDEIVGFDIAIAKEIAKDLGVELEIKDMKFEGLLPALKTGKIDFAMAGMTPKPERKKQADFSKIYYRAVQGMMVRAEDKDKIKAVTDLTGKVVGAQKASIQADIAKSEVKGAQVKELGKVSDLVLELQNKKIDAIIVELPVAEAYVSRNTELALAEGITFQDAEGGSAIAVNKGNTTLIEAMDKSLDALEQNKAIEKFVVEATELVESK